MVLPSNATLRGVGDGELLDAWAGGDLEAGRLFFARYAHRLTRFFARKLTDEVPDLVQRTFLKCLEQRRSGTPIGSPGALLFAIARNELYDAFRRRMQHAERFSPEVTSLADLGASPSQQAAQKEQERAMLLALAGLPLDHQLALELYYWEELSMDDLAVVLGVTKTAAISRVHRARELLRERMGEKVF
jgi:RNA polymerase sigma-70 factor (ECF subfamily)